MEIKLFNTSKKNVRKEKNIFIGISLGVKPLTKEVTRDYFEWALKNTKEKVVCLIADEIAAINYQVFSRYNSQKSLKRATRDGKEMEDFISGAVPDLLGSKKAGIIYWKDIWDSELDRIYDLLKQEFNNNELFRKRVLFFVELYAKKRRKVLSEERLVQLSEYVLRELPTLLNGVRYNNEDYKLLLYPTFVESGMGSFVASIFSQREFITLKKRLNIKEEPIIVEAIIE